ncbi:DNA cytosine methyltransferase [Amycolatopsis sp. NBC_00438]|uniref:DNA cytosine methyltransferase n=1 Tax=Amycolatopsis sp. NBC_00438 TaxID=2903558 RepID=UPI002E240F7F
MKYNVIEICAGAGGQALGLHRAGFKHKLAVELDQTAADTLETNFREKLKIDAKVAVGDVADPDVWEPKHYAGDVDLLAGGVPCPPFTIAGKQLGANDERDLFAWAIEQVGIIQPRALLLENVRGLSLPRFAGYRQHVLDQLAEFGYIGEWRLLQASDFGVPQLRPRFVLVAFKPDDAAYFHWPEPQGDAPTVGETLRELMGSRGWKHLDAWVSAANKIGPTIVGGSKKHGGADLGPTRAKRAWAQLGVDALGVANEPPGPDDEFAVGPKLTTEMVELIQGFPGTGAWDFLGKKTSRYRQIGNAFPPRVAEEIGKAIFAALEHTGTPAPRETVEHDPVYKALKNAKGPIRADQMLNADGEPLDTGEIEKRITMLSADFEINIEVRNNVTRYELGEFKAFTGQDDHGRHEVFLKNRARIS